MADLKTPLAFVGGLVTGAAATWVVSAKYFNKKIDDQIASIRDEFEAAKQELRNESEMLSLELEDANREIRKLQDYHESIKPQLEDALPKKKASKKSKAMEELENKPEPEEIVAGKTDYTAFSKGNNSKKTDPDIVIDTAATKKSKKAPYIIDYGTFAEDDEAYEKALVTYFSNDNLLIDTNGDICGSSLFGHIGKNNLNTLVRESDGVLYVRNDDIMVDFKVVLTDEPFGYDDEEDEVEEED